MTDRGEILKPFQFGNESLWTLPKVAFLASRKITPENVLAAHAWATRVREESRAVISGFQSELERDVLKFLLRGTCPIIVVRGNRCPKTMPTNLRAAAADNRILVVSLPTSTNRRVGETAALRRNRFVVDQADEIVFGALDPQGHLAELTANLPEKGCMVLG